MLGGRGAAGAGWAGAALTLGLHIQLRLLAPFLPYVTEEVWSWWQDGSIHRASWPDRTELPTGPQDPAVLDAAAELLAGLRGAKSSAKVSMRTEVTRAVARGPETRLTLAAAAQADIVAAGRVVGELVLEATQHGVDTGDRLSVTAELG